MEPHQSQPPDALLAEQAYLVERGVRSLAVAGTCREQEVSEISVQLARAGAYSSGAVPFVVDRDGERFDYGFAASRWANTRSAT